jgi:ferredoxin
MATFVRVIDTRRCMGCRACIAACYVENYFTPDAPWNVMMEFEVGKFPNVRKVFITMNCMPRLSHKNLIRLSIASNLPTQSAKFSIAS